VKASLGLEPSWVIQNECSRQTMIAIHVAVRNHNIREKVELIRPMRQDKERAYVIENT